MKRRGLQSTSLRLLGLFLLSTGLPALAEPAAPAQTATRSITPELEVRELRPGILIFTHSFPYPANMVLVEMQNRDLVLVDTTYTPEAAGELLAWIEQRFGKRRLIAVNTHFHVDRIGGNAALLRAGVPVYGSDRIAGLLRERGEAMRELMLKSSEDPAIKAVYRQMDFVPPDRVFPLKQGLKLSFGAEEVRILFTGEGHAPDNVTVYFPSRRLLVGGCMILAGKTRGNTTDANLSEWSGAVKALLALKPDFVIPGHGPSTSPELLQHTLDVLAQP